MNILVLNCGSSSVKYKLIDMADERTLAEGGVEKIGLPDGFLKYKRPDGTKAIKELGLTDHKGAVQAILNILTDPVDGCIENFSQINAVGHRLCTAARSSTRACSSTTPSRPWYANATTWLPSTTPPT